MAGWEDMTEERFCALAHHEVELRLELLTRQGMRPEPLADWRASGRIWVATCDGERWTMRPAGADEAPAIRSLRAWGAVPYMAISSEAGLYISRLLGPDEQYREDWVYERADLELGFLEAEDDRGEVCSFEAVILPSGNLRLTREHCW